MKDVPPGKCCYIFQYVDWEVAKRELASRVCMAGNVPLPLLAVGSPEQAREYCKNLIDTVAGEGGYIMSAGGAMDDSRPENVKAMFDFTREYGVYGAEHRGTASSSRAKGARCSSELTLPSSSQKRAKGSTSS